MPDGWVALYQQELMIRKGPLHHCSGSKLCKDGCKSKDCCSHARCPLRSEPLASPPLSTLVCSPKHGTYALPLNYNQTYGVCACILVNISMMGPCRHGRCSTLGQIVVFRAFGGYMLPDSTVPMRILTHLSVFKPVVYCRWVL